MSSAGNKKKDRRGFKKMLTGVVAVAVAIVLCVTMIPQDVLAATDANTSAKYHESLGDDYSTEYAGRIWTDKSVDESSLTYNGQTVSVDATASEEFLITFSALSTSQSITGSASVPVDVVFVIDTSGSMDTSMGSGAGNRLFNAVTALNDSVKAVLEMNPNNRVGVVAFNCTSYELLPLDTYTQYNNNEYFTCEKNGETITIRAKNSAGTNIATSHKSSSGTNIQKGISAGLNILATETDTTVTVDGKEVTRIPAVVMLSDGQPSNASTYTQWWNINSDTSDRKPSGTYAVYGTKALMTGAYMKKAVDVNYNLTSSSAKTAVYTIGVGIDSLPTTDKNLAYVTLDPETYLSANNTMANTIRTAWNTYVGGGTPSVDGYIFNHPNNNYVQGVTDIDSITYVDEYYGADSASQVAEVFRTIVQNISINTPEVPTEIKGTNPITDGYITYTDPIGEYMEVKNIKALVYNNTTFVWDNTRDTKTTSGTVTTYTFKPTEHVNTGVYENQSVSNIIIQVTQTDDTHQTMEIKVPAALIPVRVNTVKLDASGNVTSHTHNNMSPVRVIYSVGLQAGVLDGKGIVDADALSETYINANKNADGTIKFYSNLYTGQEKTHLHGSDTELHTATVGDTTVTFEPSHTNPFYYMQEDVPIYTDAAGTIPATGTLSDDVTYFYATEFYHGTKVEKEVVARTGKQLKLTNIITKDGNLYREADSPRLNRIMEFEGLKDTNATNTAQEFYFPTFEYGGANKDDAHAGYYKIYLGNNGVIAKAASGELKISKDVVISDGLAGPTDASFTFQVKFNASGAYEYDIYNADGTEVTTGTNTIASGATLQLKDGQYVIIENLPNGTTYKVTETKVAGFTTASDLTTTDTTPTEGAEIVKGTIAAGVMDVAEYTNTYSVKSETDSFGGKKVLTGRDWNDDDTYTFRLVGYNDAPMPATTEITVTKATAKEFNFGTITFDKPGTYQYVIEEKDPATVSDYLPGISYSQALYEVIVTVTDKGDGTLAVSSVMYKEVGDDGIVLTTPTEVSDKMAVFTNTYNAQSVTWGPIASKVYTDTTGQKPLTDGMFTFQIDAVTAGAPMPANGIVIAKNIGNEVYFEGIEFTQSHIGKTYEYKLTEVLPTEATASNGYTFNGMTYDPSEQIVTVVVDTAVVNGVESVRISATYSNGKSRAEFTNTYNPTDAEATIGGTKVLTGRDWQAGDEFTFTLSAANDAAATVLVADKTATVKYEDADRVFDFGELIFSKTGTYEFNITETKGTIGGIRYDSHTSIVTVTVTDNGQGALVATTTYLDGTGAATFTNTYGADPVSVDVNLKAIKDLDGRQINVGEFFVNITPLNGAPMGRDVYVPVPSVDTDNGSGHYITSAFDVLRNLTFTAVGTYEYQITEVIPTGVDSSNKLNGVIYDTKEYILQVVVTDNLQGKLVATTSLLDANRAVIDSDGDYTVTFENKYEAADVIATAPEVDKELLGNRKNPLAAGEFNFKMVVTDATNNVVKEETVANEATGWVNFSDITFTETGIYTATITEVIPADADKVKGVTYTENVLVVKYIVTDNGLGELVAVTEHVSGNHTFTNTYSATGTETIYVHKTVTDKAGNAIAWGTGYEFTFEVVVADEATAAAVKAKDIIFPTDSTGIQKLTIKDGTADHKTAGTITINKPGTYKFNVHEVVGTLAGVNYDGSKHTVTITATDNGDGTIETSYVVDGTTLSDNQTLEFVNVYDPASATLSGHNNLRVDKTFTGREDNVWFEGDEFIFKLEAVADYGTDVELPAQTTLKINNINKLYAHFGDITFHKVGTYQFRITEVAGAADKGIAYDDSEYIVTVEVTDPGNAGILQVEVAHITKDGTPLTGAEAKIAFTNTYDVDQVELIGEEHLKVTKILTGRDWFDSDVFKFTLAAYDSKTKDAVAAGTVVLPDNAIGITATKAAEEVAFGNILFKEAGTYMFVINEVDNDIAGVDYDMHDAIVTVTVTDDNNGNLLTAVPTDKTTLTFTNTYTPEPATATFAGKKVLDGRSLLPTDEFTFNIQAVTDRAPMPPLTTVKNNGEGISFGSVQFTNEGTYEYVISETDGHIPGIAYDAVPVNVKVVVTNNVATGKLEADVTYTKAGAELSDGFVFTNTYTYDDADPVSILGYKHVTPTANHTFHMETGDFSFGIEPSEHNPVSDPIKHAIISNAADGSVSFGSAVYTEPGTYVYTIHEVDGKRGGIVYDQSVYTVTVDVTDDVTAGKLATAVSITKDGVKVDSITFNNVYDPGVATAIIHGHKHVLGGHKTVADFTFNFTLTATNAEALAVTPTPLTTQNTETGLVKFEELTFTHAGTYTYDMTEVEENVTGMEYDDVVHKIVITVTDLGGELKADVIMDTSHYGDKDEVGVFNNTYIPTPTTADFKGTKILDGRPIVDGEFEFDLIDEAGKVVKTTKNVGKEFAFKDVPFEKAGTYSFTIIEKDTNVVGVTYDLNTVYAVEVVVEDKVGELKVTDISYLKNDAKADVVFNNSYKAVNPATIQLGAVKTLTGRELKAGEFTFLLTGTDGTKMTATNAADGSILFEEIQYTATGTYEYVITEEIGNAENVTYDGSEYKVVVTVTDDLKGNYVAEVTSITESVAGKDIAASAVSFENAYEVPDPGTSPKTNDVFNIFMFMAVLLTAGFGLLGSTVYARRR